MENKQKQTTEDFFAYQEPRRFPLPKKLKPYIKTKSISWGANTITVSLKANGTGKVELLESEERVGVLYIQGTDWQELSQKTLELRDIVISEAKRA